MATLWEAQGIFDPAIAELRRACDARPVMHPSPTRLVCADIGGTHARFAIATVEADRIELRQTVTLRTNDHASFESAWNAFAQQSKVDLPADLAMAVAAPVNGPELSLTNSHWRFSRDRLRDQLGLNSILVMNDFGAVAHAVAAGEESWNRHLTGPEGPLPESGVVTILGPGTGLGVALLLRRAADDYDIVETEAGHVDFAPLDAIEDRVVTELRKSFRRVSVERLVSGPGLRNIYEVLGLIEGAGSEIRDEAELWSSALERSNDLAVVALERFCMCLGAVAGDLALAHGASAVVIGGGIGKRLQDVLPNSGFAERFVAKGRYSSRMASVPVKLITRPEPGLYGAAAAFARQSRQETF